MSSQTKNVTWLLLALLQKRVLPWPTLSLVEGTITAYARATRYSRHAKKNWSTDKWMNFLEENERIKEECRNCVELLYKNSDFTKFNEKLEKIRQKFVIFNLDISGVDEFAIENNMYNSPNTRSITWMIKMFMNMYSINPITHVLISKIFEEDIREIYSSKEKYIEGILMKYPKYEQLYATCEDYIARFSENCDLEMLNSNLELIRQRLVEMPMSE